jgi:hypothetical protein
MIIKALPRACRCNGACASASPAGVRPRGDGTREVLLAAMCAVPYEPYAQYG